MLSRVADSLYWMSRYIERAENNARIADVNLQMLLDLTNQQEADPKQQWDPIVSSLEENELFASLYPTPDGKAVIDFVSLQKKNPNSIYSCLTRARENARTTSEQISSEMWEQINRLYLFVKSDAAKRLVRSSPYEFFNRIISGSHLFQGITDSTMTHGEGWDFIRIGKLLERADCTSRILDIKYHILLPSGEEVGGNVDTIQWMSVLKSCSALEAYRKIYVGQVAPWRVAEFRDAPHLGLGRHEVRQRSRASLRPAPLRPRVHHDWGHLQIRVARIPGTNPGPARRHQQRAARDLLRQQLARERYYGLSSSVYQLTRSSPKKSQVNPPKAR
jgi:uncharacterized alpha-E superfamily protein